MTFRDPTLYVPEVYESCVEYAGKKRHGHPGQLDEVLWIGVRLL